MADSDHLANLAERVTLLVQLANLRLLFLADWVAGNSLALRSGSGHPGAHPLRNQRTLKFGEARDEGEEQLALRGGRVDILLM